MSPREDSRAGAARHVETNGEAHRRCLERPTYVASNTLTDPQWADTTVLSGDVAAAIVELKARPGRELQVHGSGVLTRWLLANELVDEMNLLIVPAVVGQGTRLFPDTGPDTALELVASRAAPKGVTRQVYPAHRARAVCEIGVAVSESRSLVGGGGCSVDSWRLVAGRGVVAVGGCNPPSSR